jgi:hypothetical protein
MTTPTRTITKSHWPIRYAASDRPALADCTQR